MLPKTLKARRIALILWLMALTAVAIWATLDAGWDVKVYSAAVRSLKAGQDPYADAIARQANYRRQPELSHDAGSTPPYNYVYSPITLPLLNLIGEAPPRAGGLLYWIFYAAGAFAMLWSGLQFIEDEERTYVAYVAPAAIFFPALLANGVILSGNIAYIVYGIILPAAVLGWKRGRWGYFYIAVLVASCFKVPYLTLLVVPVFSQRKQWIPAALTAAAGAVLLAAQPVIWPTLFKHFMQAVNLQMLAFRDFGSIPAGIFASYMLDYKLDASRGGSIFYLLYAVPLCCFLFLDGAFPLSRWIPVLLLGVILLSPRIQEYDFAILTIPMALIIRRTFIDLGKKTGTTIWILFVFFLLNLAAAQNWALWKDVACVLLVTLFSLGSWQLIANQRHSDLLGIESRPFP